MSQSCGRGWRSRGRCRFPCSPWIKIPGSAPVRENEALHHRVYKLLQKLLRKSLFTPNTNLNCLHDVFQKYWAWRILKRIDQRRTLPFTVKSLKIKKHSCGWESPERSGEQSHHSIHGGQRTSPESDTVLTAHLRRCVLIIKRITTLYWRRKNGRVKVRTLHSWSQNKFSTISEIANDYGSRTTFGNVVMCHLTIAFPVAANASSRASQDTSVKSIHIWQPSSEPLLRMVELSSGSRSPRQK